MNQIVKRWAVLGLLAGGLTVCAAEEPVKELSKKVSSFATRATHEGNKLIYKDGGQTIVIQAWGRDSLRVRVTPEGGGQTSD